MKQLTSKSNDSFTFLKYKGNYIRGKIMKKLSTIITGTLLMASVLTSNLYAAEHEVKMLNSGKDGQIMVFEPAALKVAVGDTVKFISKDMGHNSVSTFTPEGAESWKGEISKEISITLNKEGIYLYTCEPHNVLGMVGVIQAGEASNKDAALKAAKELSAKFTMNKDRLEKYIAELESAK